MANEAKSKADAKVTLITGGARSGKSRYAQEQVEHSIRHSPGRVLFIATAERSDVEMEARIDRHILDRPSGWHTLEAPLGAAQQLAERSGQYEVILLDCLTLFLSNVLMQHHQRPPAEVEAACDRAIADLCSAARSGSARVLIVTNEVGMGLHPMTELGRLFQDLAGRANQQVASAADEVILMVCGIPMKVKG